MDSQKPLRPNFRKGGMKKVLEEELPARSNYATTAGICVGESSGAKTSFWPELLENPERTDSNEIRSTAESVSTNPKKQNHYDEGKYNRILGGSTLRPSSFDQRL